MNFLDITLESHSEMLHFGKSRNGDSREFGITAISGLESSSLSVSTTENALVDGSTIDGKRIKSRSIHIEATLRDDRNNDVNRQRIIRFFNPKYSGILHINYSGTQRNIEYEIEGWAFVQKASLSSKLSIVIDLICPDPYMKHIDNFGQNMANVSKQIAFPYISVSKKTIVNSPYKPFVLLKKPTGYKTLSKQVHLPNDGDVATGVIIEFIATRGPVQSPIIKLVGKNKFVKVNCSMNQGDILVVDTNKRHQVIELNGKNVYQYIDRLSSPFELEVGENYLEYDADINYTNLDVKLYYTPLYLGV